MIRLKILNRYIRTNQSIINYSIMFSGKEKIDSIFMDLGTVKSIRIENSGV
jgi:hypothetical protein